MYYSNSSSQDSSYGKWITSYFVLNVLLGIVIAILAINEELSSNLHSSLMLVGTCNVVWTGFMISFLMVQKSLQPVFPDNFVLVMAPINITLIHVWLYILLPNKFFLTSFQNAPLYLLIISEVTRALGTYILTCTWIIGNLYLLVRILGEICKKFFQGLVFMVYTSSVIYAVTVFSAYLRSQQVLTSAGEWLIAILYGMIFGGATIVAYFTKQRLPHVWYKLSRKQFLFLLVCVVIAALFLTGCFYVQQMYPQLRDSTVFYEQARLALMIATGSQYLLFFLMIIECCCCCRRNFRHHESFEEIADSYLYMDQQAQPIQYLLANPPISIQTHQNFYSNPPISINQNHQSPNYVPSSQQHQAATALPTRNENREFNFETSCCICLEEYQPGEKLMGLKCGHIIHKNCAEDLKKVGKKCPLCRAEVF